MSFKSSLVFIKVVVAVLSVTAVVLAFKLYSYENEIFMLTHNLDIDKKVHNNEISEILIRYDSVLIKNQRLAKEISFLEKDTLENSNDQSIKSLKGNISILKKGNSSKEKQLATLNSILKLKQIELENNKTEIQSLNSKITLLQSEIKSAVTKMEVKKLRAINVNAIGAQVVSENVFETKKIKNTEQIKVCFTLEENESIEKGAKDIFVQIINPKSNIFGKTPSVIEIKNKTLFYSTKTVVNYDKEDLDVCVYVEANQNNLLKGNYIVNIFSGANLIGNTNLSLL